MGEVYSATFMNPCVYPSASGMLRGVLLVPGPPPAHHAANTPGARASQIRDGQSESLGFIWAYIIHQWAEGRAAKAHEYADE